MRQLRNAFEQLARRRFERSGKSREHTDSGVATGALQTPDLGRVHAGSLRKDFLRKASPLPRSTEICAELWEGVRVGHGIAEFDAGPINPRIDQS
jgi:hypothetical protein